jgi:putative membrane protein
VGKGWARGLLDEGEDPDPRFTLSNERTFLSWTRTALALIAAGVALEAFDLPALGAGGRRAIATVLLLLGAALAIGSFRRWLNTERAMRNRVSIPAPALVPILSLGIGIVAIAVIVLIVIQ